MRVDVEVKRVEVTDAACWDCRHQFKASWRDSVKVGVRCPKCGGECNYEFFPDPFPYLDCSVSTIHQLYAILGLKLSSSAHSGRLDPKLVIAHERELAGHRFGRQLVEVARAAARERAHISWD